MTALALVPSPALTPAAPGQSPAAVYLARLAPGSRRAQLAALDRLAELLTGGALDAASTPWGELRYQHTQAVRAALAERYAPATANRHLSALRGALKEAWRLGQMTAEDYRRAADLETVRGSTVPAGREVTVGEARALLDACADDPSPSGARDAALFALLYGVGLRRAEAVALELADYDAETGRLTVRAGKGRKARVVYATNGGRAAVEDWLVVRGPEPGALLCPVNKGGRMTIRHMTAQAAYSALRRRAHTAGVASFTPHDLRRTFAGDLLDDGADLATVQNLMGHANPATTARYDRRGERAKKKAAELRRVPYTPKQ